MEAEGGSVWPQPFAHWLNHGFNRDFISRGPDPLRPTAERLGVHADFEGLLETLDVEADPGATL
jgi:hypothetical protein